MRVLVACEYSGRVREAFRKLGHDALSCDLLDSEDDSKYHIKGDVIDLLNKGWDLLIAHPPCTHLAVSGARHFAKKRESGQQQEAIDFFMKLATCDIPKKAIENPVCIMSSVWRKPDQIIHPYMFGHPEQKSTCLWLEGLPILKETNNVKEYMMTLTRSERERVHMMPPCVDRWKERSRTFQGIADAMAEQWGGYVS